MNSHLFSTIREECENRILSLSKRYPSISGIAVSVLSLKEFDAFLKHSPRLLQTHFTKEERAYCKNRMPSLAGRYAAKLAFCKASGKKFPFISLSIRSSQSGQPILQDNVDTSISITHEDELVVAFVAKDKAKKISVGVDVATIERLETLERNHKDMLPKILTAREIHELTQGIASGAEKWAGKESVSKVLGSGIWHGGILKSIEIIHGEGRPRIILSGKALQQAENAGLQQWEILYVADKKFQIAFVLARTIDKSYALR